MLLSSCPRCHDSIRIPATAQVKSVVRCPRCREEFPMHEIMDQLPPEAEIVSGPGAIGHTVMPTNLADATEYVLAGEEAREADPDFRFKETGSLKSDVQPMAKIDSSRPPRRPKRPEPNMAAELVKVVVGGLVGLTLAYLIVLWVLKQDPLQLADKFPAQAYIVFPEQFRTAEMKKYARGDNAPPAEEEEEIELTVEKISIDKFPEPETTPAEETADKPPVIEQPPTEEEVVVEEPLEQPAPPREDTSDIEDGPDVLSLEEEISMATQATELLGEIGAQIPPLPGSEPVAPTNVGNLDLSPVDGDEN